MARRNRQSTFSFLRRLRSISTTQLTSRKRNSKSFFGWKLIFLGVASFVFFGLIHPQIALAAPGGKIASALFKGFWGKVLLGVLCIIFLPFIIYVWVKEWLAERRTLKDLRGLSQVSALFDWFLLKERIIECFHRVHSAWRQEDMKEAAEWMTNWYWQNQQLAYLDRWQRDGLINHCRVRKIASIRPLFLRYRNESGIFDGSRIAVAITADMEDYLAERTTGEIVEGAKGFQNVESVWTFIVENNKWVLANIEEGNMALAYAKLANEVPAILHVEESSGLRNTDFNRN